MNKISIRNSRWALIGLEDLIRYIKVNSKISTKEMTMVEIGSYVGDSTKIFAENFKLVISIDPFINGYDDKDSSSFTYSMDVVYKQFKKEILDKYSNVQHLKIMSIEGSKFFVGKEIFDFVYIDGNHQFNSVQLDIQIWLPKIKSEGWIGGHDYANKNAPEVKKVVDNIFITPERIFKDTSWIKKLN